MKIPVSAVRFRLWAPKYRETPRNNVSLGFFIAYDLMVAGPFLDQSPQKLGKALLRRPPPSDSDRKRPQKSASTPTGIKKERAIHPIPEFSSHLPQSLSGARSVLTAPPHSQNHQSHAVGAAAPSVARVKLWQEVFVERQTSSIRKKPPSMP